MPAGLEATVPVPAPLIATVNGNCGTTLNVAVTLSGALITTEHGPVPEHAPPQPANAEPLVAVAVSVTAVREL